MLALIDGDGAIFQDALLQAAGAEGGSEAATRLDRALRAHISSLYENSGNWSITVQVYLSLDKLAKTLCSNGLLRAPSEMRNFVQEFNINQPLFSIIDVGYGKERADFKLREMLRTFSDNPTCRHIVFSGLHDAGYLLNLERFKHHPAMAGKITLLETTKPLKGFSDLANFKRARFDDVFRSEPLPSSSPSQTNSFTNMPLRPVQSPIITQGGFTTVPNGTPEQAPRPSVVSPSAATPPLSVTSDDPSWAAIGKEGVPVQAKVISIAPEKFTPEKIIYGNKNNNKKKYAYYNKAEQRLDLPLPTKDPQGAASLEARMKKTGKKMCNNFHLGGSCENGKFCSFQHEPRLPAGELNALRYKARSLPCKMRYCEDVDCYMGHQCPNERDNGYCSFGEKCHLRNSHGMDRVKYVRWDKDGNEEYAPGG